MFSYFSNDNTNNAEGCGIQKLFMKGKEVHSLDELRENFDAEDALRALNDGTLKAFLKSHYYEMEFDAISGLSLEDRDCLKRICISLGIDYLKPGFIMSSEAEARLEEIKKYTADEKILKDFNRVALSQEELANLLNSGEKVIYICHNKFSIPLSKGNITYIGVDNPAIENPFTLQQYKKAGISIENIALPLAVSDDMNSYALTVAKENGYDDYADNNSPLAAYFHGKLKCFERFSYIRLPYNITEATKEFKSEFTAKQELRIFLKKPYDAASAYVTTGNSKCVAKTIADEYSEVIEKCFTPIMDSLKTLCNLKGKTGVYKTIEELVSGCRKTFIKAFNEEITDNQDYYNMYDFNYFVDNVTIEEHDNRIGEGVLRVIETLFADNIDYTYSNFFETVIEMEKDINDHVSSFYKYAYREYLSYVKEIEKAIEELGNNYPEFKKNENITDYLTRITLEELK